MDSYVNILHVDKMRKLDKAAWYSFCYGKQVIKYLDDDGGNAVFAATLFNPTLPTPWEWVKMPYTYAKQTKLVSLKF